MTKRYHTVCSENMSKGPSYVVCKATWAKLFQHAWEDTMTDKNLKAGFKFTGIWPLNPSQIPAAAFAPSLPYSQPYAQDSSAQHEKAVSLGVPHTLSTGASSSPPEPCSLSLTHPSSGLWTGLPSMGLSEPSTLPGPSVSPPSPSLPVPSSLGIAPPSPSLPGPSFLSVSSPNLPVSSSSGVSSPPLSLQVPSSLDCQPSTSFTLPPSDIRQMEHESLEIEIPGNLLYPGSIVDLPMTLDTTETQEKTASTSEIVCDILSPKSKEYQPKQRKPRQYTGHRVLTSDEVIAGKVKEREEKEAKQREKEMKKQQREAKALQQKQRKLNQQNQPGRKKQVLSISEKGRKLLPDTLFRKDVCILCLVVDEEQGSIFCEKCKKWMHISCVPSAYRNLANQTIQDKEDFYCHMCMALNSS